MSSGHLFCADRSGAETEKPVTYKKNLLHKFSLSSIITYYGQGRKNWLKCFQKFYGKEDDCKMSIIYAEYNVHHNSIDIATAAVYLLRIDCWEAEKDLKTTPGSECTLNALAIDEPLDVCKPNRETDWVVCILTVIYRCG